MKSKKEAAPKVQNQDKQQQEKQPNADLQEKATKLSEAINSSSVDQRVKNAADELIQAINLPN